MSDPFYTDDGLPSKYRVEENEGQTENNFRIYVHIYIICLSARVRAKNEKKKKRKRKKETKKKETMKERVRDREKQADRGMEGGEKRMIISFCHHMLSFCRYQNNGAQ